MRVGLFVTCLADLVVPEVAVATVLLLEKLGLDVVFPESQSCCGQMHINTGYPAMALPMVRSFVASFEDCDVVVSPSGSCVGAVRHQHRVLAEREGDQVLAVRVAALAPRVRELTEFLVDDLEVVDVGARFPHKVAYHPSCHSLRVARVGDRPIRLLAEVGGLELVQHDDAQGCCGFGGSFAVKNADVSAAMLQDKMRALEDCGAEYVTSVDASCLTHVGGGLTKSGSAIRHVHIAEILAGTVV